METAKNQVKVVAKKQPGEFYSMSELKELISGKSKVKLLSYEDFKQTKGNSCRFTFEGGFYVPSYPPQIQYPHQGNGTYVRTSLYDLLLEKYSPDLVIHYSRLWDQIIDIFNDGFYAFYGEFESYYKVVRRPYDKVQFAFIYNTERSLDSYKNIFTEWVEWAECQYDCDECEEHEKWHAEPSDTVQFYPANHIFYDLCVYVYKDGSISLDPPTKVIEGVPHFAIPAVLEFIGDCLSQAQPISQLEQKI